MKNFTTQDIIDGVKKKFPDMPISRRLVEEALFNEETLEDAVFAVSFETAMWEDEKGNPFEYPSQN